MINLIYWELFKTYAKWRTYIGFIAIGVLIPVIMWIMWVEGGGFVERQLRSLQADFLITGNLFNGWAVAQIIMNGLWVHVPALIALVAGDQLSGEATAGTFRLTLIRPVSRTRILNAKYLATLIYTASLVVTIAVLSVGLGLWIFGTGDLLVFDIGGLTILCLSAGNLVDVRGGVAGFPDFLARRKCHWTDHYHHDDHRDLLYHHISSGRIGREHQTVALYDAYECMAAGAA